MRFKKFMGQLWKYICWKIKRMKRETKKLLVFCLAALLVGSFIGSEIGKLVEAKKTKASLEQATDKLENQVSALQAKLDKLQKNGEDDSKKEIPWYLVLVNSKHPMEKGYVPKLTEIKKDYSVDSRIADATNKMLNDAKAEGLHIVMCSAYRSVERQEKVFNESLEERLKQGMSYWEAFDNNRLSVAEPGTSEHALGLALDLISNQYSELDKGQETTKEAKWLKENCYKYGFILRYPPEKTEITGIVYEPWHYRYVGVEDATKIMELGVTLEEYLETYY